MIGMSQLKNKLGSKRARVDLRYRFYEMKETVRDVLLANEKYSLDMQRLQLGWCSKAVDSLADRLLIKGWSNDQFNVSEIFDANNPDVLYDSAIISALIGSCSFICISLEDGYPRFDVIDGRDATGVVDPATNMLTEGYAVLSKDESGNAVREAYFLPGSTEYYFRGRLEQTLYHPCEYPLLVPIIYRPDAKRPFGHSRITRACMAIMKCAIRTIQRSEVSADYYSFPQKYVLGLHQDAERLDKWKASVSSFLQFSKDEDGDKPALGQFNQASMTPFNEQMRNFAALFAGETGLTLDDLGFVSENPSSAEAIKASHETLRLTAKKAQRNFSSCFLNAAYLAVCLRDNFAYKRSEFLKTKLIWEPIFEPDAAMLSGIGDGAIKLNQAVPGYFGKQNLAVLTGIEPSEEHDYGGYTSGTFGADPEGIRTQTEDRSNADQAAEAG